MNTDSNNSNSPLAELKTIKSSRLAHKALAVIAALTGQPRHATLERLLLAEAHRLHIDPQVIRQADESSVTPAGALAPVGLSVGILRSAVLPAVGRTIEGSEFSEESMSAAVAAIYPSDMEWHQDL